MEKDTIAAPLGAGHDADRVDKARRRTLGNVRLRHPDTNEIILIPTPSSDPNDPLNWPQWFKYWIAALICFAMLMCNFLAAGPSIAIVQMAMDFFPGAHPGKNPQLFNAAVAKVAYSFTTTALLQGLGNFVWVPIANKYGRRPTYVLSYAMYFGTAVWLCFERSYGGFLVGRILMGFAAGAAETVAPITIADIFFLHERGSIMAFYSSFLAIGVALGLIISGLITIHHHWRVIFQVASALIGLVLLLAIFAFPETAYIRNPPPNTNSPDHSSSDQPTLKPTPTTTTTTTDPENPSPPPSTTKKTPYLSTLSLSPPTPHRTLTTEPLPLLLLRPLPLLLLPPILYTTLTFATTIGFLVALTSNAQVALSATYGFASWQVGLCFVAAVLGALAGIPAGGRLGDVVADWGTRRNGGVREPEMRLPVLGVVVVVAPVGLVVWGVGVQGGVHWMLPVVGIGLLNFAIVQGTNVALVYVIDAYRPVAGEITTTIMAFKSLFGFLLSFYTNPWVAEAGYIKAYGVMAAISAAVLLGWVPLFFWGKKIRHATWRWRVISYIHWNDDREVGE
ncbi:major facilitator superfamily domain-containing protein [Chaetomium tenue]|uniref:Major facilitator superfamily domain-containing protein n=1 Tax=Chaetomium tenue TaxID=1854479 RepID=A0ACB7PNJ1_9PEZI|nr:major facilitator superfamily domain-containing protein [Chaetomium globosum]